RDAATRKLAGGTEMDTMLRDAEKRLASAQRTGAKSLDSLPLLYLMGEANAAKTTAVLKSGLDPELLAGQIYRDQDVIATPVVNIWYTQQCVIVEAGDAVRKSPALWQKLIRKTRPKAYRSAMGTQAPVRAAVVCLSCEQFLGTAASEAVLASARATNQMLRDLAQQLGTDVPVYVVFTKLDRVPNFTEYLRNLTTEEVSQPLGMAFARTEGSSGLYAEKAMAEVTGSLDRLTFSLGEFRLEVLSRETDQKNVDPDYEFPRELKKLRNNLANYLVELGRPSHLNANPYLRGFYFTGVRAHMVEQMVSTAAQAPKSAPAEAGATRMFSIEQAQAFTAQPAQQVVTQKVAQWCFLPKLFPVVVLGDRSALASTSHSGRTHVFRRFVFGTVSLLLLFYLVCLVISFGNNSRLEHQIASAANALPTTTVPATMLASRQDLASLDKLRDTLVQLETFRQQGPPLMYRWGLYHGDQLFDAARRIYFDRFRNLLLANTQNNLVTALNGLPASAQPDSDYLAGYNPLKAYLITTSNADKSTSDFLTPVLTTYWLNGRTPETGDQKQLAQLQFDFYANELRLGNPYSTAPAASTVDHAQIYLASFGGLTWIYQQLINGANKAAPAIDFNRQYPGSAAVVTEPIVVQGAFTHNGYAFVQDALQHPQKLYSGEDWVLGKHAPPTLDPKVLTPQLASRYVGDYLSAWRTFLKSAHVVPYGIRDYRGAAAKLQILSGPGSPLLQLICTASQNTAVPNQDISKDFQPAQVLAPPESCAVHLPSDKTGAYLNSLVALQGAMLQVAGDTSNPPSVQPISGAAIAGHGAVNQTAQAFNVGPSHMEQTVFALLDAPIRNADAIATQPGASAGPLCEAMGPLMAKFPFSPNATVEASPAEISGIFQPVSGQLWQFYDGTLKPLLSPQGPPYSPALGAAKKVTPAFLQFFNKAATISNTLYPGGATTPTLSFTAHIHAQNLPAATLILDSQQLSGADVSKQFTWSGQSSQAQLIATYGTAPLPLDQFSGPWALFHLIGRGQPEAGNPGRFAYPVGQTNTSTTITSSTPVVHLEFSGPGASLLTGGLSGLHCVAKVTQ
ncbi:MAG TPA: ImcF-related family protein, partial [Silvibacterium sp.]|nr:ImcF-related family protein [Silvibacterium sp.]